MFGRDRPAVVGRPVLPPCRGTARCARLPRAVRIRVVAQPGIAPLCNGLCLERGPFGGGEDMRLDDAINIEDLHQMAKRRLPKVAFDFIEGGLEDEHGLDRNTAAFTNHHPLPRYLAEVWRGDQPARIFGQPFPSPFAIPPPGAAGLFRRGAALMLA